MFTEFDRLAMTRALALAERGLDTTHPTPRVGCVIAKGDRIIGEGFHERAGEPHAEVMALRSAKEPVAVTQALFPHLKETTEHSSGVETTRPLLPGYCAAHGVARHLAPSRSFLNPLLVMNV